MVEHNQQQVLVLEDDVRFELNFKSRLNTIMEDVRRTRLHWDLMYVGYDMESCLALGKHMAQQASRETTKRSEVV